MTMQTMYFKEHEASVRNSMGKLSPVHSMPWWCSIGAQSVYGESYGQSKLVSTEHPTSGNQLSDSKHPEHCTKNGMDKGGNVTQFTLLSGIGKKLGDGQKAQQLQAAVSMQSTVPEYLSHFELGFGQTMICGKYPSTDHCYKVFSAYGPQIASRIMLPLNLTADEGPIYVNPKQYHGIIRRRQSRAKAELENKLTRARKPYMHESRHLHAMRRPRGCGGRFMNSKNLKSEKGGGTDMKSAGEGPLSQPTGSQNSEVLQSHSGTLNTPKEAYGSGSNHLSSEATSMYTSTGFHHFSTNHFRTSVHSLSNMTDTGHGNVMPSKWVASADNCCNLKV